MPKCKNCNKKGFFLKLDSFGWCENCKNQPLTDINTKEHFKILEDCYNLCQNSKNSETKQYRYELGKETSLKIIHSSALLDDESVPYYHQMIFFLEENDICDELTESAYCLLKEYEAGLLSVKLAFSSSEFPSKEAEDDWSRFEKEIDDIKNGKCDIFKDFKFTDDETVFFTELKNKLAEKNLSYKYLRLKKNTIGTFSVDYIPNNHMGKINLNPQNNKPTQFAVMKSGNKRASKVFFNEEEAKEFCLKKPEYYIEKREDDTFTTSMEYYLPNEEKAIYIERQTLDTYISYIPYWVEKIIRNKEYEEFLFSNFRK